MHLYLIRHADPSYNPDELTPAGHKEAAVLAPRLKAYGVNRIFSSDMIRTKQTAQYASDLLGIPIEIKPWLMEPEQIRVHQDGVDYVVWDTYGETIRMHDNMPGHDDWHLRPPFNKGTLYHDWLDFFCHNGSLLMMSAHLLEIPLPLIFSGFYCWPCSLTDIYFDQRSDNWAVPRALHVADVSHLIAAGLKPQARGMGDRCDEYY